MCKQRQTDVFYSSPSMAILSKSLRLHSFTPSHHLACEIQHPVLYKLKPQNKGLPHFRPTNLPHTLVASGVQYRGSGKTCGQKLFSLLFRIYVVVWF